MLANQPWGSVTPTTNASANDGTPGYWCQWIPDDGGGILYWDEGEKFYEAAEWMIYLIDHFLRPGAVVEQELAAGNIADPQLVGFFEQFTFDHMLNGVIGAQGEEDDDRYDIVVEDNNVSVKDYDRVPSEELEKNRKVLAEYREALVHASAAVMKLRLQAQHAGVDLDWEELEMVRQLLEDLGKEAE